MSTTIPSTEATTTLVAWLEKNDMLLWAKGTKVRAAYSRYHNIDASISFRVFNATRISVCQYWKVLGRRWKSRKTDLTTAEWQMIQTFFRQHPEAVAMPAVVAIQLMRKAGLPANRSILVGSLCWKGPEKTEKS